ncbi:MAG: hypothetical protein H6833_14205, partial [Planctomycetes bacterium]|nr:hypothetical protein [Planctomycetota bacterium]
LFNVKQVGTDLAFGTDSTATNIHSHYVAAGGHTWSNYEYTGRMRITSTGSAIGVTVLSNYPNQDAYYRLRRFNQAGFTAFHLDQHPDDPNTLSGDLDSGVVPAANQWYRFRIRVLSLPAETQILARIWTDGSTEPATWQVDATDASATRLTQGTVGVWSFATGSKYWDDLKVSEYYAETGDCDDGNGCTIDACENKVCVHDTLDCSFLDGECAVGVCVGTTGMCAADAINEDLACTDDGDACTLNVCSNGACIGRFLDCDGDTICDAEDNCPSVPNTLQENADFDAYGDACDALFDTDHDGDVDNADLIELTACITGPGSAASPTCQDALDADLDGDVDLEDFAGFQQAYTGTIASPCD